MKRLTPVLLKKILPNDIEAFYLSYKSLSSYHLQEIAKGLEFYPINFKNIFITGDFSFEVVDAAMKFFTTFINLEVLSQNQLALISGE